MPPAPDRNSHRRRRIAWVSLAVAVLVAIPTMLPVLVRFLAPAIGCWWGLTDLAIRIERPGWRGVAVPVLAFTSGRLRVEASDGRLDWRVSELRHGRLDAVAFAGLRLVVNPEPSGSIAGPAALPAPDDAADLLAALPFGRAEVHALELAVPAVDFAGAGRLLFDGDALAVGLTGQTPAAAAGLAFDFRANRSGNARLIVSERTPPGRARDAESGSRVAVELRSDDGSLDLAADVRLDGFAWDLAAGLLDLPQGPGTIAGRVVARAPWPVGGPPDLAALTGEVRIARLRWTATTGTPGLELERGVLRIEGPALTGELAGRILLADAALPVVTRVRVGDLRAAPLVVNGVLRRGPLAGLGWALTSAAVGDPTGLKISGDLELDAPLMKRLVDPWRSVWDLDAGALTLSADLRWPVAAAPASLDPAAGFALPEGHIAVALENASAHYADYRLAGLRGSFVIGLEGGAWLLEPTEIRAAGLAAGIDMTDLAVRVAATPARLAFADVSARGFGGLLAAGPFDYDLAGGTAAFDVRLAGVDLAQVLALYGDRVAGTGTVDGTLPVTIADGAFAVRHGVLEARPPGGVIRIAPELTRATGQSGLDFALTALANFTYTRLAADVDYAPTGDLTLAVALRGRNPEVEGGRPIHYNLNVTENVPQLLESLTLHSRLVRDLERRAAE